MEIYLEAFIDYLRIEKGLSPNSIAAYGQDLKKYINYLKRSELVYPKEITRPIITPLFCGTMAVDGQKKAGKPKNTNR